MPRQLHYMVIKTWKDNFRSNLRNCGVWLSGKYKKPLSRGSHEMWQKKGTKKGLSTIFQMTITALAFLAFAGYLLCLLVQAIKAKQNSTATGTTSGISVTQNKLPGTI